MRIYDRMKVNNADDVRSQQDPPQPSLADSKRNLSCLKLGRLLSVD